MLGWAERVINRARTPLPLKELAWRLIRLVQMCGRSNLVSFALRPLAMHRRLQTGLGMALAVLVVFGAVWDPLPSAASDTGGMMELVVMPEGEVSLVTDESVQVPLEDYRMTQKFWFLHAGLDMATLTGAPIRPVMAGRVIKAERDAGYGNHVIVEHNGGYESLYAHMSKIGVSVDQQVSMDTILGEVGSTGHSTGPHLHLEIREGGKLVNPGAILGI
ncbi:MAG: peptidase M23 [Microgenomates group bacterium Gr01-1014_16]|nr:MAG: peptidase M23 [Microgenomates group bacterium Gr01-1014_16]